MARKDFRNKRQSWSKNPLVSGHDGALVQAVAPFLDWVKLQQNTVTKFNDKGRPDHVTKWVDFQCIVTPRGERTRRATAGGDRFDDSFHVQWLKPSQLPLGSILIHPTFGMMKITSYDEMLEIGLCSSEAVALSAGVDVEDGNTIRNEQKDIF